MPKNVALVAGASGVVGGRLSEALVASGAWRVIGCARRIPESPLPGVDYAVLDLGDAAACRRFAGEIGGVTHLFYTARHQFTTGQHESVDLNTLMFRHILDALDDARHPLQHVHMVHGTKYYGSTLGRFPTPALEGQPRTLQDNFYYQQEDIVLARGRSRRWSWSSSRPHIICDFSLSTPRSLPMLIGTYAAICRHLGQPLCFPGTAGNYHAIGQCTDARLLARAIVWMATVPSCADQAFNVTNGDFFRWENLWPVFARHFGLDLGPVQTIRLSEVMPARADVWTAVVAAHGLVKTPFERMALWSYGDFVFTPDWDVMSSTTKLRRHGFPEVVDTQQMFLEFFERFSHDRILPPNADKYSTE